MVSFTSLNADLQSRRKSGAHTGGCPVELASMSRLGAGLRGVRAGVMAGPEVACRVADYRAMPARLLCSSAAAVASLAESRNSITMWSQCAAACAIFVPR